MATYSCNIALNYNQRGLTVAQFVQVTAWLKSVQTKAATAGYTANVSIPTFDDDKGRVQGIIAITMTKTGDFTQQEIQAFWDWISANITTVLPAGTGIDKNHIWVP